MNHKDKIDKSKIYAGILTGLIIIIWLIFIRPLQVEQSPLSEKEDTRISDFFDGAGQQVEKLKEEVSGKKIFKAGEENRSSDEDLNDSEYQGSDIENDDLSVNRVNLVEGQENLL